MATSPQPSEQRCGRCKQILPLDSFSPSYRGKTGTWCRACFAEYNRHRKAGGSVIKSKPHDPIPCGQCGVVFVPRYLKPREVHFCSRQCKEDARRAVEAAARIESKPDRICVHCGADLPKSMRIDAKFCSAQCNDAAHAVTRKMAKRANTAKPDELVSRAYIAERDGWRCGLCGGRVSRSRKHPDPLCASIDHIVPVAAGGTNDLANLQLAHLRCNLVKRDRGTDQLRLMG